MLPIHHQHNFRLPIHPPLSAPTNSCPRHLSPPLLCFVDTGLARLVPESLRVRNFPQERQRQGEHGPRDPPHEPLITRRHPAAAAAFPKGKRWGPGGWDSGGRRLASAPAGTRFVVVVVVALPVAVVGCAVAAAAARSSGRGAGVCGPSGPACRGRRRRRRGRRCGVGGGGGGGWRGKERRR